MQNTVKNFNEKFNKFEGMSPENRILDIQSELGELSKEVLKGTDYGKKEFTPTDNFILEFGDTIYSLLCLANETGINSKEALNKVLEKYEKRFSNNGNFGSSN